MEIVARFSHDRLDFAKDNTPHLIVTLRAPQHDWVKKRPALCVLPLADLSGSMRGPKLEYAKKSLHKLVDQLALGDFTGLLGFENRPHVLVEPGPVTPEFKIKLHKAIDNLAVMGGTDLNAGVLRAVEVLNNLDLSPKFLKRVIMFTDGQPNQGVTDQSEILRLLGLNRGSVTVSAFGYGNVASTDAYGGCDQDFLQRFSLEGRGNYAYVKDPDDALTAFGRELGGLLSTYGQDLVVEIEPEHGHQLGKVITDITVNSNVMGETEFKFPEILAEETRHFVFETALKKQTKVLPRALNFFTVKVSYTVLTEEGKRETRTAETRAKATFVDSGEQKEPHKDLDEVVALAQVVRAQMEAEELAKKGAYDDASRHMEALAGALQRRGRDGATRVAHGVSSRLMSASAFSEGQGYLRSMSRGGTRAYGVSSMDADAQSVLLSANVSLSNSSQQQVESLFTGRVAMVQPLVVPLPPEIVKQDSGQPAVTTDKSGK